MLAKLPNVDNGGYSYLCVPVSYGVACLRYALSTMREFVISALSFPFPVLPERLAAYLLSTQRQSSYGAFYLDYQQLDNSSATVITMNTVRLAP